MLDAMLEILLALLASIGLLCVFTLLAGKLGQWETGQPLVAVIPAQGDGDGLEQTARTLDALRQWGLWRGQVLVADCGLNEEGRRLAQLLCRRREHLFIHTPEELCSAILCNERGSSHEGSEHPPTQ